MPRELHARGSYVGTMFGLVVFTSFSPQLIESGLGSGWGVWFDPTHTYSMDKFGNLLPLPFRWDKTTLRFGSQR